MLGGIGSFFKRFSAKDVYLDEKLNLNTDITEKIGKSSKGIGVIKKLL